MVCCSFPSLFLSVNVNTHSTLTVSSKVVGLSVIIQILTWCIYANSRSTWSHLRFGAQLCEVLKNDLLWWTLNFRSLWRLTAECFGSISCCFFVSLLSDHHCVLSNSWGVDSTTTVEGQICVCFSFSFNARFVKVCVLCIVLLELVIFAEKVVFFFLQFTQSIQFHL